VRHLHSPPTALEQREPETRLQVLQLMADCRLTEVQKPGGARHSARLGDGLDQTEIARLKARDRERHPSTILIDRIRSMRLSHERRGPKVASTGHIPEEVSVLQLFFSRASCSFVAHVALEEAGVAFDLSEVVLDRGEQLSAEYLAINPLGRVPALRLESGAILTEVPAILEFVAECAPERRLLPVEPMQRVRAVEWMSLFVSSVHPAFIGFYRPQRFTDNPEVHAALAKDCRARFFELLQHVDLRLSEGGFVLGDRYSLCDPYAALFFMWGRYFQIPVEKLARYAAVFDRTIERPAWKRAFAREGLRIPIRNADSDVGVRIRTSDSDF
jgi:glutathione S-transferase